MVDFRWKMLSLAPLVKSLRQDFLGTVVGTVVEIERGLEFCEGLRIERGGRGSGSEEAIIAMVLMGQFAGMLSRSLAQQSSDQSFPASALTRLPLTGHGDVFVGGAAGADPLFVGEQGA